MRITPEISAGCAEYIYSYGIPYELHRRPVERGFGNLTRKHLRERDFVIVAQAAEKELQRLLANNASEPAARRAYHYHLSINALVRRLPAPYARHAVEEIYWLGKLSATFSDMEDLILLDFDRCKTFQCLAVSFLESYGAESYEVARGTAQQHPELASYLPLRLLNAPLCKQAFPQEVVEENKSEICLLAAYLLAQCDCCTLTVSHLALDNLSEEAQTLLVGRIAHSRSGRITNRTISLLQQWNPQAICTPARPNEWELSAVVETAERIVEMIAQAMQRQWRLDELCPFVADIYRLTQEISLPVFAENEENNADEIAHPS